MKKVFITTTPLQGKDDLKKLEYVPQQFELAQGNRNTAFPIIPIIAEHLKDMGETEIIVIRMENRDTSKNYQRFVQEVEELGLDIPVCGMVKDDNHRTRGLYYNNVEIPIDRNSEGFRLITRIQDEAHRFAIEFHRSLRSKEQVHSVLDDIEGIGPARRKALMRQFQSLEAIREADVETLAAVPSMNRASAEKVWAFFH